MLCSNRMQAAVLCSFIISEVVMVNAEVTEISSPYSCCGKQPAIEFRQECENTWDINNKNIARSKGSSTQCISPCKKIEGGVMTLDECVDVNVTVVCRNEMNVTVEKRIYHYSQPCSGSQSNKMAPGIQGFAGLSLLAVLIAGLFVM
ncbi:uncharacterized protein LOC143324245 [Chaetodon auriga]|uniref:uncharacterized protein LOC143324245 n=1 Tax=Chaetodon auriga TaxID=39042 RepID=UPI0040331510